MSYLSIAAALSDLFAAVPGVTMVQRDDALQLGTASGAPIPPPSDCPVVRIGTSRRYPAKEQGWLMNGTRDARTALQCEVWAYGEQIADADAFLTMVEALQGVVRQRRSLDGRANTATSRLIDIRPVEGPVVPRTLTKAGQPLFHAVFTVLAREGVWG